MDDQNFRVETAKFSNHRSNACFSFRFIEPIGKRWTTVRSNNFFKFFSVVRVECERLVRSVLISYRQNYLKILNRLAWHCFRVIFRFMVSIQNFRTSTLPHSDTKIMMHYINSRINLFSNKSLASRQPVVVLNNLEKKQLNTSF